MHFLPLVQNELMKINSKRQSVYFFLFLLLIILAGAIVIKFFVSEHVGAGLSSLSYAYYMHMTLGMLVTIFALVLGAQTISDEYRDGTIKQLLIRPHSRTAILFSKYAAIVIMTAFFYLLLLVTSLLIGAVFFGMSVREEITFLIVGKVYLYSFPSALFFATLSFFMATVFKSSHLALSMAIVANFVGGILVMLTANYPWAKYLIFANTDLSVYDPNPLINNGGPVLAGTSMGFSVAIIIIYLLLLLFITNLVFQRRDV